jgi:integrase
MPKRILPLTDAEVKKAKAQEKPIRLYDGGGLSLIVTPAGGKLWRLKYRFESKERRLALGAYPETSLAKARQFREEARRQIAQHIDPAVMRKARNTAAAPGGVETFEFVAHEWLEKFKHTWKSGYAEELLSRLERDLVPWMGQRPISEIKPPELLTVLRRIESRGALETAHRIKTLAGQVFRYAIATGRAERDPSADLKGALPPVKVTHLAAITDPKEVGPLLRALDGYEGHFPTKCALRLSPYVFARPGELRHMEWVEIDLGNALWMIPAEKMKGKKSHLVPLCRQSVQILTELRPMTGISKYVFPSPRTLSRPMSENAVIAALRRMGYEKGVMTGQGFRAMARTILDEVLEFPVDVIEHQLAHTVRDPLGRAYNRTTHLPARRDMMQKWADYLDELKATVSPWGAVRSRVPFVAAAS